jgi:hypothetical protein
VIIVSPSAISAQDQPNECGAKLSPPGDLSLHLSLKNGQTVFREGEIIALTAEYTAQAKHKYSLNNRNYDRGGRLDGMEVFCLDPDKGVDPLRDYFNNRVIFGGGLGGDQDPAVEPYTADLELNEWLSLPPGSYRLSIAGNRVTLNTKNSKLGSDGPAVPLRSNTIEFQVLKAEPEWQSEHLASALLTLDSASATKDEKKHAARVFQFLGSEASTRELARRYWSLDQEFGWEMQFGLYGSKFRAIAIQEMKDAIKKSQHPISTEFADTLATMEMQADPKYRELPYDEKDEQVWKNANDAYSAEHDRRIREYMAEAATAAQSKSGEAKAISASEQLMYGGPLTPEARTRLRQMLLASWDSLSVEKQDDLIGFRWEAVGGPEWMPVLKGRVAGNRGREEALHRIWEISPEQGRPLILREIAAPKGDIGIAVLGLLPERELPQIEAPTIARIKNGGNDIDFQLIDRYASVGVMDQMKSIYEASRGKWACVPRAAMLRYFLRVSPDYGTKEASDALRGRKRTGCYRTELSDLKELIHVPQMEKVVIAMLDDRSPSVVWDAAEALQEYGSPKAEAALWARLEKLHNKWKDKPDERLHPQPGETDSNKDSGLEQALVEAIANGQAWFANQETIRRLKSLSSPAMQENLDDILKTLQDGNFTFNLTSWPDTDFRFTVGWYQVTGMAAFKEKLAQFPAGAHFIDMTSIDDRRAHSAEIAEVVKAVAANGQTLEIKWKQ